MLLTIRIVPDACVLMIDTNSRCEGLTPLPTQAGAHLCFATVVC